MRAAEQALSYLHKRLAEVRLLHTSHWTSQAALEAPTYHAL